MDPSAGPGEGVFLADVEVGNVQVGSWALERRFDGGEMLRSARRPCKACDSTSSADSETGCILGSLIKELLVGSDCYLATGSLPIQSQKLLGEAIKFGLLC